MKQFFILTASGSLYRAYPDQKTGAFWYLQKTNIAPSRNVPPAAGILAICPAQSRRGVVMLFPREKKDFLDGEPEVFMFGTSPVVALFEKMGEAMAAYEYPNHQMWDQRWLPESVRILRAIGEQKGCLIHPDVVQSLLKPKKKAKKPAKKGKPKKTRRAK